MGSLGTEEGIVNGRILGLLLAGTLLTGCAAGPALQNWPSRQIDRPYTLPKGMAQWSTSLLYSHQDGPLGPSDGFLPWPLNWRTALSEDWTLVWVPLPLGLQYQALWDGSNRLGFLFVPLSGFGVRSSGPTVFASTAGAAFRAKFNDSTALDLSLNLQLWVTDSLSNDRLELDLKGGPFLQAASDLAVKPTAGLSVVRDNGVFDTGTVQGLFGTRGEGLSGNVGGVLEWSMDPRWDMTLVYSFSGLGHPDGFTAHTGALAFTHNW